MGFVKRAFEFLLQPSHSRTMGLVLMLFLVTAVSLTVYVAQQQQTLRQRASPSEHNACYQDCNNIGDFILEEQCLQTCDDRFPLAPTPTLTPTSTPAQAAPPPTSTPLLTTTPTSRTTQTLTLRGSLQCRPVKTVNLSWNAIKGASSYRIWRNTNSKEWDILVGDAGEPGTPDTTYDDSSIDITKKHTYQYYVMALDNKYSAITDSKAISLDTSVCLPVYPCAINKEPREFHCSASRPDIPNKDQCLDVSESWTCEKVASDIKNARCWQCRLPTPTPAPSSQCREDIDCKVCLDGNSCQPVPGRTTAGPGSCDCRPKPIPVTSPTPTPTSTPTPTGPPSIITLAMALNAQNTALTQNSITVNLSLYNLTTNTQVSGAPATQSFAKTAITTDPPRQYTTNISLTNLAPNKYFIIARRDNMIAKSVFSVTSASTTITVPTTTLVFGDINNDNDINMLDSNAFRPCYKKSAAGSCAPFDFDKNEVINEIDYNTLLRGFATWNKQGKEL